VQSKFSTDYLQYWLSLSATIVLQVKVIIPPHATRLTSFPGHSHLQYLITCSIKIYISYCLSIRVWCIHWAWMSLRLMYSMIAATLTTFNLAR